MIWLLAGGAVCAMGYIAYASNPAVFVAFDHLAPLWLALLLGYTAALRGAYGTWRFPFLGFPEQENDSSRTRPLVVIWAGAILFRALLVSGAPVLSDDVYRYLWDGKVLLHGINPYRYPPNAPELAGLRDALWPFINHPELPTIYPPLCMLVFAWVAWITPTVLTWKVAVVCLDLLAGYAFMRALEVRGKPRSRVALYLWHPLVLLELAGNGHVEALGLLFVGLAFWAWAKQKPLATGLSLGLGGMVKFLPWVAVPSLLPRLRARWALVPLMIGACYLSFWRPGLNPLGSLGVFVGKWRGNDFLFSVFVSHQATEAELRVAKLISLGCVCLVWLVTVRLRRDWISTYAWTVGTVFLLSPVVHPWYVIWLLPVLFVLPHPAWWVWSCTVIIAYQPLAAYRATGLWEESLAWKAWEVSPALTLLPLQAWLEWKALRFRPIRLRAVPSSANARASGVPASSSCAGAPREPSF
jgi:hypothetical protein